MDAVVAAVADVYVRHTRPWFVGLVAFGSYVKGGMVAGSSDLDLRLYLEREAFDGERLPWPVVRAIQADLAEVDPAPFAYVQCHATPVDEAEPLVPGTWRLLDGTCPARAATAGEVREAALRTLAFTQRARDRVREALLDSGGGRLEREVRLMATDVWPAVYAAACLTDPDPLGVWALPKTGAVARLGMPAREAGERFLAALAAYHANGERPGDALATIDAGLAVLAEVTG